MSGPDLVACGTRRCTAPSPWVSNPIITVTARELEQSIFELYDLLSSVGQNTLEDEVVGSSPAQGNWIRYHCWRRWVSAREWVRSEVRVLQQVFAITV